MKKKKFLLKPTLINIPNIFNEGVNIYTQCFFYLICSNFFKTRMILKLLLSLFKSLKIRKLVILITGNVLFSNQKVT